MFYVLEPPEDFELDADGLQKLEKRLNEAIDSGELGPTDTPVPKLHWPWSMDPDPQGDR